jgi:hypothetical protein
MKRPVALAVAGMIGSLAAGATLGLAHLARGRLVDADRAIAVVRASPSLPPALEVLPTDRQAVVAFALGDRARALALARRAVEESPGDTYPLALLADLSWRAGHASEAQETFRKLRPLSATVDLDLPLFRRLTPIAQSLALPTDWRVRPTSPRRGPRR